jgi:hypothetical protein
MKLYQLFYDKPPIVLIERILKCYGLRSLTDNREFNKSNLVELKTVDQLIELIPELMLYYLPCKANVYLNDITEKRSITILSQNLKLYEHRLVRDERIINQKKVIFYRVKKIEDTKIQILNDQVCVNFL